MSDWQPIGTAPKDGTVVLLSTGHDMAVCRLIESFDGSRRWVVAELGVRNGRTEMIGLDTSATHWMPLPAPPEDTA